MAETKIDYLRLEPADNGCIISYDEITKGPEKGTFDSPSYVTRKEVFDFDNGEDAVEDAFKRFKELFLKYQSQKGSKY